MKKAKALIVLFSWGSFLSFIFAIISSGPTPENLITFMILAIGFYQMVEFQFTRDDLVSGFLPFSVLALLLVLGYGIWTFITEVSLQEVRLAALMSVTPTFILIGVLLEIFDREN